MIAHIEHGYGLREIATHLGCSVTTVHRREIPVRSSSFHLPVIAHIEHGYSLREIATRLVCSVTTVHRRVHAGGGGPSSSTLPAVGTKKT